MATYSNTTVISGGLFEYVSGANYFSECLEWTGYALASWSWAGFVMAAFTAAFLGSRAMQHHRYIHHTHTHTHTPLPKEALHYNTLSSHRYYLKKFEDYPKNRKALIPFVL